MSRIARFCIVASAAFAPLLFVAPAHAACFEIIGCTDSQYMQLQDLRQLSCESLWLVRNTIYDENGYCFVTDRALQMFSNAGCTVTRMARVGVQLNDFEKTNVTRVVHIEREFGCP